MVTSGLLADEFQAGDLGSPQRLNPSAEDQLDARRFVNVSPTTDAYSALQAVRGTGALAIGALAAYADTAPPALRGRLYAQRGYADLLLADLFCSGVPLSTVDVDGGFTYHASSTTDQVYQDAIAQFTQAIAWAGDSTAVANLAWVGEARAYLDRGRYDSAAAAAAHVPEGFTSQFTVDWSQDFSLSNLFQRSHVTVADREGSTGLPYRSSADPRTATQAGAANGFAQLQSSPLKYGGTAPRTTLLPFTVADWIEARLIQAEAAWHGVATGQGTWLDQLNALRADPTAITPSLPALTDPGTPAAQVDLLFQERAAWLFLTGHRLGDLRRLVRTYHRGAETVFPTGPYPAGTMISIYGPAVSAPIPAAEFDNPLFQGCLSPGA
jgi:tetratricopeptide (TPR) repeat protein